MGRLRKGLASNVAFIISASILLTFTFFALWPQLVAPYNPTRQNLLARHKGPGFVDHAGGKHLLGTDHLGRDILSRVVYGARASLTIGYSGLLIGGIVGTFIGLIAGYRGGWFDRISMRVVDAYLSFPYILIAIVWAALLGTSIGGLVLIIAARGWVEFARVVRTQTLSLREREYVTAIYALGAGDMHIVLRHILPNIAAPILVIAGFQLGRLILLEATLSFLGLGIQPPTPAWGTMLADARLYMTQAWWTVFFPGIAISLVVLSVNFLGDGLRDRLDPTLRNKA